MEKKCEFYIRKFDEETKAEFFSRKGKWPAEFYALNEQSFQYNRNIYVLMRKRKFSEKPIGYAIITDYSHATEMAKDYIIGCYKLDTETFLKHKGIYLNDFMILSQYRRRGIGADFYRKLKKIGCIVKIQKRWRCRRRFAPVNIN